jgi:hypothetical protein
LVAYLLAEGLPSCRARTAFEQRQGGLLLVDHVLGEALGQGLELGVERGRVAPLEGGVDLLESGVDRAVLGLHVGEDLDLVRVGDGRVQARPQGGVLGVVVGVELLAEGSPGGDRGRGEPVSCVARADESFQVTVERVVGDVHHREVDAAGERLATCPGVGLRLGVVGHALLLFSVVLVVSDAGLSAPRTPRGGSSAAGLAPPPRW